MDNMDGAIGLLDKFKAIAASLAFISLVVTVVVVTGLPKNISDAFHILKEMIPSAMARGR